MITANFYIRFFALNFWILLSRDYLIVSSSCNLRRQRVWCCTLRRLNSQISQGWLMRWTWFAIFWTMQPSWRSCQFSMITCIIQRFPINFWRMQGSHLNVKLYLSSDNLCSKVVAWLLSSDMSVCYYKRMMTAIPRTAALERS